VVWVEDVLIKSGKFSLPGKKELLSNDTLEVVLVDVTESPVERPKKSSKNIIVGKRKDTPLKR
jgi:tricorn protease-like protein